MNALNTKKHRDVNSVPVNLQEGILKQEVETGRGSLVVCKYPKTLRPQGHKFCPYELEPGNFETGSGNRKRKSCSV